MQINTDGSSSVPFSSFYYKGSTPVGSCSDWLDYTNTRLILPYDNVNFIGVSAAFGSYNYATKKSTQENSTCSDPVVARGMMNAIKYGFVFQGNCDGHSWRVFTCNSQRVICINCKLTCVRTEACPGASYIVNPCDSQCTARSAAYSYVAFRYVYTDLFPKYLPIFPSTVLPALPSLISNVTSLTVLANATAAGRIYCAAYVNSSGTVVSINKINAEGTAGFMNSPGLVSVVIRKLQPDTTYAVFCYTEDFVGHIMPIAQVLANKVAVQTLCCRHLYFSSTFPVQNEYSKGSDVNKFSFALSTVPTSPLQVILRIVVNMANCKVGNVVIGSRGQLTKNIAVSPSHFNFSQTSTQLSREFSIIGFQGCYDLTLSSVGVDTYIGDSAKIKIVSATTINSNPTYPLPVPLLTNVVFSDDGTNLLFNFDIATNTPMVNNATFFLCGSVVSFRGSDKAVCTWTSPLQLSASMSSFSATLADARPEPDGQTAALFGPVPGTGGVGWVQALCFKGLPCSTYPYSPQQELVITAPTNPIVPRVFLVSPALVGSCDDILVDPTGSFGNGGRPWKTVLWAVRLIGNWTVETQSLTLHLNAVSGNRNVFDATQLVTIPRILRGVYNGSVTITLTLTNFLGQSSQGTVLVSISSLNAVPRLTVPGPAILYKYKWQPISLIAVATIPACAGAVSSQGITYAFKVYEGPTYKQNIQSTSLDSRVFKLDPYTLDASSSYTIQVSATGYSATNVNPPKAYYNVIIQTGQSGIAASIKGGSVQTIAANGTLILDAGDSTDIDQPQAALKYEWTCSYYSTNSLSPPFFGSPCGPGFPTNVTFGPVLTLPPKSLSAVASPSYNISVRVSNQAGVTATASVRVMVLFFPVPKVSILSTLKTKYNPEDMLVLTATVTGQASGSAVWSCPTINNLADIISTPLTSTMPSGTTNIALAVLGNTLSPGATYTFSFTAAYQDNVKGSSATASVTVLINQPPSGGSLTVAPVGGGNTGDALSTPFLFQALAWSDDPADYPLKYLFAYYVYRPEVQIVVKPSNEMAYAYVKLGQGRSDNNRVTCVVNTSDIHGATSSYGATKVAPGPVTVIVYSPGLIKDLTRVWKAGISSALTENDPTQLSQALTAVSFFLTLACPGGSCVSQCPSSCAALNRQDCASLYNQCGECLPGYVGVEGESNFPCALLRSTRKLKELPYPLNSSAVEWGASSANTSSKRGRELGLRRDLAVDATTSLLLPGQACVRGSSVSTCISGECANNVCTELYKTCLPACTASLNLGRCVFIDNFGKSLPKCLAKDRFCHAMCKCPSGRHGADCSLLTAAFTPAVELRADMCKKMQTLVGIQDTTKDIVMTRGSLFSDMFTDLSQLSDAAFSTCFGVLLNTIGSPKLARILGSKDVAAIYFSVSAKILNAGATLSTSTRIRLHSALQTLTSNVQANLALGEAPVSAKFSALRASTAVFSPAFLQQQTLQVPLTGAEAFLGILPNTVQLDTSMLPAETAEVGVTLLMYPLNPTQSSSNSTIVTLQTTQYKAVSQGRRRLASTFPTSTLGATVTMQNYVPIIYHYTPVSYQEHQCYRTRAGAYDVSDVCPDGTAYTVRCPGTKGAFNITCPSHRDVPRCDMWDGAAFSAGPTCAVMSFSATATTCRCAPSDNSSGADIILSRFRRLTSATVIEQSFSASMMVLSTPLVQQYFAAPAIIEAQKDVLIAPTMWAFVGMCALIILFTIRTDQREINVARKVKTSDAKSVRTAYGFFENVLPFEFIAGDWQHIFFSRLFIEHSWLAIFATYHKERDYRTVKLATSLSNVLVIIFLSTLAAGTFYSDDGSCEFLGDATVCTNIQSPLNVRYSCEWHEYNSSCGFKTPTIDALGVLLYAAAIVIIAGPATKALEFLARSVLIHKRKALDGMDPFPWQGHGKKRRPKESVVVPVLSDRTLEEGPNSPAGKGPSSPEKEQNNEAQHSAREGEADSLDGDADDATPKREIWNQFAKGGPRQEYWERCDELSDAQKLVPKILQAARLRKLQEYTDFVLPMEEVSMLTVLSAHELKHFGRQLLVTEAKDKKSLLKSETVKRARFAMYEPHKDKVLQLVERTRLESERIKNEVDLMKTDNEKESYIMQCFAINNLKGFRQRIAERYILGEGRFESPNDAAKLKLWRMMSFVLLVVLWALLIFFVLQFNLTIGSRASQLWIVVTLAALLEDVFLVQPLRIWFRYCVVNSTVSKDLRQIYDALSSRFVHIIQRRAGVMRDANSLVQHFNPDCRAARTYPHLPVSRLLLALNDYDVPHFQLDDLVPLAEKRQLDWWLGLFVAAAETALEVITRCAAPVQDALLELLVAVVFEGLVLMLYVAGLASPITGVLLGLSIPLGVWSREWWKQVLRRRVQRRQSQKRQQNRSEGKLLPSLLIETPGGSPSGKAGLKQRASPGKSVLTVEAMLEKTGKDAYLVDDLQSRGVDHTEIFASKFKTVKKGKELVESWRAYKGLRGGTAPSAIDTQLGGGGDGDGDGDGSLLVKGLDLEAERLVLPTLMQYGGGGGGSFGQVREKAELGAGLDGPPIQMSPSKKSRLAYSLERLEHSITQNLESVVREALQSREGAGRDANTTLRDQRKKAAARRLARKKKEEEEEEEEEAGGGAGAGQGEMTPQTDSPPDDRELRRRQRRRKKRETPEDVVAAAGPGTARRLVELVVERGLDLGHGQMLTMSRPNAALPLLPAIPRDTPNTQPPEYVTPALGPGSAAYQVRPENARALGDQAPGESPAVNRASPLRKARTHVLSKTDVQFPSWHGGP